jgi:hypothetical protein
MLFHWNIRENPSCECGVEKETIQHIVEECHLTKFQQHTNIYGERQKYGINSLKIKQNCFQKNLWTGRF